MRKLLLLIVAVVVMEIYVEAQSYEVQYKYDVSGNRVKRKMVEVTIGELKSATKEDFLPVEDQWSERQVTIYPNPTHGNLKVNITGGDADVAYSYELYNSSGSKMLNGRVVQQGETPIPMESLSPGVYILILQANDEKMSYKIIKK